MTPAARTGLALTVSFLASTAAGTCALPASADDRATPAEAGASDEPLIARGIDLRKRGEDAEALAAFESAYRLRPSPRALAQIALAQQALGRWAEAERALVAALASEDDAWIERQRGYLAESLVAVRAHLASLSVSSNAAGADLWIDGRHEGELPLREPIRLAAGKTRVEVRAPGREPIARVVDVVAGAQIDEVFTFGERDAAARGAVSASAPPLDDGAAIKASSSADVAHGGSHRLAWLALGGAAGLLAIGVGGMATREIEAQLYDDDARCGPTATQSRRDRCGTNRDIGNAAEAVAVGAFIGSGILGAVSGVLLLQRTAAPPALAAGAAAEQRSGCGLAGTGVVCRTAFDPW